MRIEPRFNRFGFTLLVLCVVLFFAQGSHAQEPQKPAPDPEVAKVEQAKFQAVKSPVPYTERSINRGKMIYRRYCTECHGLDGKAQIDVVANATNLTNPAKYLHGTTEGEIFHSVRDGAGVDMPPFKAQMAKEEDLWNLVNFTRSLWPEDKRPELKQDESKKDGASGSAGTPAQTGGADHE
jgi:mono/diheme cytochrome c family protein